MYNLYHPLHLSGTRPLLSPIDPQKLNYPQDETPQNRFEQYTLSTNIHNLFQSIVLLTSPDLGAPWYDTLELDRSILLNITLLISAIANQIETGSTLSPADLEKLKQIILFFKLQAKYLAYFPNMQAMLQLSLLHPTWQKQYLNSSLTTDLPFSE
ncbi:MAG: hypothetical protein RLZ12_330 [Bacillota bacterium]|jgi:hypothetical protein